MFETDPYKAAEEAYDKAIQSHEGNLLGRRMLPPGELSKHPAWREAIDAAIAADRLRLIGTDEQPGILDQFELRASASKDHAQEPLVTYYCGREHERPGGHVHIIARDLSGDQSGLTIGEMAESALNHEKEHHGGA